mgnify:CR=1 FL=1
MKLRLKKDIVIKAGTIFDTAPSGVSRAPDLFVEATFAVGRSKDTYGSVTYMVGKPRSNARRQVSGYFEVVND